jgi:hypothetical protein
VTRRKCLRIRTLIFLASLVTVSALAEGCSTSGGLPVNVTGGFSSDSVQGVNCDPQGSTVDVTGNLTANSGPPYVTTIRATALDSSGNVIGGGSQQLGVVNQGQTQPFDFTMSLSGTPASCDISWLELPPD